MKCVILCIAKCISEGFWHCCAMRFTATQPEIRLSDDQCSSHHVNVTHESSGKGPGPAARAPARGPAADPGRRVVPWPRPHGPGFRFLISETHLRSVCIEIQLPSSTIMQLHQRRDLESGVWTQKIRLNIPGSSSSLKSQDGRCSKKRCKRIVADYLQ